MKIVKIILLTGLVISALPNSAHTHEELEKQNAQLRKQLMEESVRTQEIVFQMQKENARLSLELEKSWSWKRKVGTFIAGLTIGWIVTAQQARLSSNSIHGATTSKSLL